MEASDVDVDRIEAVTPMQEINKALEACKFGRFHVRLLFTAFVGFIAITLVTNSTSYLLPNAECDLNMNLKQKGVLSAMPYFGMFISSIIAGFLTDTFGRILFLRIGFGSLFFFALLSASSQTYTMIAAAKLGEGISMAISAAAISSITCEFCHPGVRDRVMLCQSSFSAMAQILSPAMAWGLLTRSWEMSFLGGGYVLKSWNFYLFVMSFWSLVAFVLFSMLPESPKFLVTRKKFLEARNVLITVYTKNTGNNAESFPYYNIFDKEIKEGTQTKNPEVDVFKQFRADIVGGLKNMKPLLQRPLISYLIIIAFMQLVIVGMYNVLRLWFPQLSTIVEHYKLDGNQNLCTLLDSYTASEKTRLSRISVNTTEVCVPHVSGTETYINSIIIGLVCMVPYFISGVVVNKVGKKCLLILAAVISVGALLGIRWANSKTTMVALFSVDIAITQTMKSLSQVVLVEVFPTTMRSLAMALVMFVARVGTLIGNIGFPILLNMGCEIPFYTMTGLMMCLVVLALFTPKKEES
ncbi:uncharacterized protein LOC142980066 isoform X2 [Anticarsia gemmatalis]|uniref:uncharacterized protein LOC142980066 isoform X2 n=1 Tax=Anticarsia gemmatalis TaxID=129554 RepID=UPI003F7601C1